MNSEDRLSGLFAEYLEAEEAGRDVAHDLLERAGELGPALEEKIDLERELRALSADLGLASKSPGAKKTLGRFEILDSLASTALSRVFLAYDPDVGRKIALKILDRGVMLEKDQGAWIRNEARALARVEHPSVVKVFEVGETGTHTYVAMELLPGPSLAELIGEWKRVRDGEGAEPPSEVRELAARLAPVPARLACLARLAEALAQCHDKGILHRDLKPQNVLFDAEGEPRLIDFGLAHDDAADEDSQLGLTQALVGTAAYIAPEQVETDRTGADARSDQFSFATLAYECFALENPFLRKGRRATLDAVEAADPPPLRAKAPEVPPELALVIRHAHERDPAARYPSVAVFADDLRAILEHRPVSIDAPSPAHLARLWLRRHRRGVTVASVAFGLAVGAWIASWSSDTFTERAAVRAQLARIRPAEFDSTEDFDTSFEPLSELQRRAALFDTSWMRRAVAGTLAGEVQGVVADWSHGLAALFRRDEAESAAFSVPMQQVIYRRLTLLESVLCPACDDNQAIRRRGIVRLPVELAGKKLSLGMLARVGELPPYDVAFAFRPTLLVERLVPGTYRLLVSEPGNNRLVSEAVFYVPDGWLPEFAIDVHAPRKELLASSFPVPRGVYRTSGGQDLVVPAFRVVDHLVTVAEFDRFVAETGYVAASAPARLENFAPDAPTTVDYDSALAYARWAGGHIPSRSELTRAFTTVMSRPTPTPSAAGELLIDFDPTSSTPAWLHYTISDFRVVLTRTNRVLTSVTEGGPSASVGFRVAFADDDPDLYRGLETRPLDTKSVK